MADTVTSQTMIDTAGTKTVMKEGGVIKSDFCRHPIKPLDQDTRNLLINFAKKYDLLSFNWGK